MSNFLHLLEIWVFIVVLGIHVLCVNCEWSWIWNLTYNCLFWRVIFVMNTRSLGVFSGRKIRLSLALLARFTDCEFVLNCFWKRNRRQRPRERIFITRGDCPFFTRFECLAGNRFSSFWLKIGVTLFSDHIALSVIWNNTEHRLLLLNWYLTLTCWLLVINLLSFSVWNKGWVLGVIHHLFWFFNKSS